MLQCSYLLVEKDEEARERDQMRYERHKDRQRERNIARAAPDKRQVLWSCDDTEI
jgi:SNW domain-containing protein 1